MSKSKQKKIKSIKAWAVCFALAKKCLDDDIRTFKTKARAKDFIHELHCEAGGFEEDHHIVKVLITPLVVAKGDKKKK